METDFDAVNFSSECTRNTFVKATVHLSNASGRVDGNRIENSQLSALNASGEIKFNEIKAGSEWILDGATADVLFNVSIKAKADITGFTGSSFNNNTINGYQFSATACSADITSNVMEGTGVIKFDSCSGMVQNNHIAAATDMDATGATGSINNNRIFASNITITNFTGDHFTNNEITSSIIAAPNCSGIIEGNIMNLGRLEADGASGDILFNVTNQYSEIYANNYSGDGLLGCELQGQSTLRSNFVTNSVGRVKLHDLTILDFDYSVNPIYIAEIRIPQQTIKLMSPQVNLVVNYQQSNYEIVVSSTADYVDYDIDYLRYCGILVVAADINLKTILGLNKTVDEFVIKPASANVITIDASTATNIILPFGVTSLVLNGVNDDSVTFKRNSSGTGALVKEVNIF